MLLHLPKLNWTSQATFVPLSILIVKKSNPYYLFAETINSFTLVVLKDLTKMYKYNSTCFFIKPYKKQKIAYIYRN